MNRPRQKNTSSCPMELYALSAELVLNKLAAIRGNRTYSWVLTRAKDAAADNTRSPRLKCATHVEIFRSSRELSYWVRRTTLPRGRVGSIASPEPPPILLRLLFRR